MNADAQPLRFTDAAAELPQRRAVDYQRRIGRRIDALRAAFGPRAATVACGGVRIDLSNALRSSLVSRLGATLAAQDLLDELRRLYPGRSIEIDRRPATADLREALDAEPADEAIVVPPAGGGWTTTVVRHGIETWRAAKQAVRRRRGGTAQPQPVDWLVFPRMPGHLTDLIPVANHARDRHDVRIGFASSNVRLAERLAEAGYGLIEPIALPRSVRREIAAAERAWRAEFADVPATPVSSDDELSRGLLRLARRVLDEQTPDVIATAYFSAWLLDVCRPKLVVLGNPYTLEGRVMGAVAKAASVPTAAVQHGTVCADDPSWTDCAGDLICTWGESSRRAVQSSGLAPERVVATGAPRYDAVLAARPTKKPAADGRPVILAAASGAGDKVTVAQHRHYIRVLYAAAVKSPELAWLVKLHRKDRREYYPAAAETPANLRIVDADYERDGEDIFRVLATAAALVTVSSTAALDAAIVGVPAITVHVWPAGSEPTEIDFLPDGTTTAVRTADELAAAARRAAAGELHGDAAESPTDRYFLHPGRACEAVVDRLLQLAEASRSQQSGLAAEAAAP